MLKILRINNQFICKLYKANSFKDRLKGFMFKNEPHVNALMISPCNSIHTFFMRFSIDVIFLDSQMKVIKVIKGLIPGKIILPVKGAKHVIECRLGLITDIEKGDMIEIEEGVNLVTLM